MNIICDCVFVIDVHVYTADIQEASITEPDTTIESIIGIHKVNRANKHVKAIKFTNTVVSYIPRGIHLICPTLTSLSISKCGLKSITREDLFGLENLEYLQLEGNQLTFLPDDLFASMKNLRGVSFKSNKIVFVSSKLFAPLANKQMDWINLEENTCMNIKYNGNWTNFLKAVDESGIKPPNEKSHLECLAAASNEIWVSGKYSDFVINVEGQKFGVHKATLGTFSPVLAAAIDQPMREAEEGKMTIEDFNAETVKDFLSFIYTGKFNKNNAMNLFAIATKYQVSTLRSICERIVVGNIDEKNALEVLSLGNLYDSDGMKLLAFAVIRETMDFEISANLKDNPDNLKKLIDAKRSRKRKMAEIEENFNKSMEDVKLKRQKEVEATEKEYNDILKLNQ